MKKFTILLMLLTFIFVFTACNTTVESPQTNINENEQQPIKNPNVNGMMGPSIFYYDVQSFEDYIYSDENDPKSEKYFDPKFYIDFSSIIPDNECKLIQSMLQHDGFSLSYYGSTSFDCSYGKDARYMYEGCKSIYSKNQPNYEVYNSLNEAPKDLCFFIYNWNGNHVLIYSFDDYAYGERVRVAFMIDEYCFELGADIESVTSSAQMNFFNAFFPAYGATDESATTMLNRIKALIPTGDEANGAQINASADASFEFISTNPIDTPSSDDSGNSEQTAGETVADTDVTDTPVNEEEEEYLYPEDYEFPVIPGISPDWKPNRNGKYPLKDGYTREEMTLLVACAIELDFGDMTDEEISKIDFIIIDDEEETEETEVPEEPEE